jgi:SRSO17 transposase
MLSGAQAKSANFSAGNWETTEGRQRRLLFRRGMGEKAEVTYYTVSAPEKASLEEIVRVAGTRWAIEESFEKAKGEVGLDHYEAPSWDGWFRHITLSMLAHAYLTVVGANADQQKKKRRAPGKRKISSR